MPDHELVQEIINQLLQAARRIERRFGSIDTPGDFLKDDDGTDKLDAICMMLIAIGEALSTWIKLPKENSCPNILKWTGKGQKGYGMSSATTILTLMRKWFLPYAKSVYLALSIRLEK